VDRELCPAENVQATLVGIFYIGSQPNIYEPDKPPTKQAVFQFELDLTDSQGRPHVLSKTMTFSASEKSTLSKWFKPIFGDKWPKDGETFDPAKMLGVRLMADVVHYAKKSGDTGAKIGSVSKLVKGLGPMEHQSTLIAWAFDDPITERVPTWIAELGESCIEKTGKAPLINAGTQRANGHDANAQAASAAAATSTSAPDNDDDGLPF